MMDFKPAKCPSCGGNLQVPPDMKTAKCMYCGGDFLIEEAIKLAVAEINLDNIFKLADTARDAKNYKEAYDYYTKILEFDADSSRAWYGKAVCAGWQVSVQNYLRLNEVIVDIKKAIECAPNDEVEKLKIEASLYLDQLARITLNLAAKNFNSSISVDSFNRFWTISKILVSMYDVAFTYNNKIEFLNQIVFITKNCMNSFKNKTTNQYVWLTDAAYKEAADKLLKTEKMIQEFNPNYKVKVPRHKKGACFIATAVYGNYDTPEVLVLRNFRDDYLDTKYLGRLFIKVYYRVSPPIANWIKNKNRLKRYSKLLLDKIVNSNFVNLKSTNNHR